MVINLFDITKKHRKLAPHITKRNKKSSSSNDSVTLSINNSHIQSGNTEN